MKKNKNRIKLPIMRLMLGLMIILSSMIAPTEVKAADETREEHSQYITEEINVEPYRKKTNADGNYTIVPESIEGAEWIFAGWYTDSSCKTSLGKDVKTGTYTAKFVPAHVLDVKAQISSNVYNDNEDDDSLASLRFVTSTDSLKYRKVGFEVVLIKGEEPITVASNTVYKKLYAVGSTEQVMTYKPSDIFCSLSQYFKACTITGIPAEAFGDAITATSFWITKDGTFVKGTTKSTTVNEGINALRVYVSSNGDDTNAGTKTSPLKTLDKALDKVLSGGTIYVLDSFTADAGFVWKEHSKSVAIKGGTIDFSNISTLDIHDSVTFSSTSLTFADKAKIYAWGNRLKIDSTVNMDNQNCLEIYGGGNAELTSDTELILLAGTYQYIYGGGDNATVIGNTNVIVGGTANTANIIDYTQHNSSSSYTLFRLCGGGNQAAVIGNTSVTVGSKDSAVNRFNYTFGGGYKGNVTGDCTFNFNGLAMSVCGGSIGANVTGNTFVKMEAGQAEQVFGGCDSGSVTGNADVQILGGKVKRRINGGSYNNDSTSSHQVIGHANVLIGPNATLSFDIGADRYLSATSRYGYFEGECGTFIFNEQSKYLTSNRLDDWNYCVKTNGNNSEDMYGNVLPAGDCIQIIPKENYVATVTIGNVVKHYTEAESYYPLPELTSIDAQTNIIVTFTTGEKTDAQTAFTDVAKASIGNAYYATVQEAIAAAEHCDDAEITLLTDAYKLVNIIDNSTGIGKIVTDKKNYVIGDTVVLSGVCAEGYYCNSITVNNEVVELAADGTYTFEATAETYTVEGNFQKKIFVDNSEWNLVKQNDGLVTLLESSTDGKYLRFHDKYEAMDLKLTVKDNGRTDVYFKFANGESVSFGVLNNNDDGNTYIVQTLNNGSSTLIDYNTRHYTLSADEIADYKGDGIDFRIVREGTRFYVFIEGHLISYEHDTYPNNGIFDFAGKIDADTKMNVTIRHFAWSEEEAAVEVPFSVSHELDKSFTEFYEPVEGLYPDMTGTKSAPSIDSDTLMKMKSAEEERFLFQSRFKYTDLDADKTAAEYARVLFDIAGDGLTSRAYRIYLYREGNSYYLKANVNGDASFTDKIVSLDENQIAKLRNDELNVFFVQTGEDTYSVYLENGSDNKVSLVEGSSYTYSNANYVSVYRSSKDNNFSGTPTITTTGYFYGSGYMTGEDVANALLASVTVTKNIAEGVTVTGLNDAYKIGDTVSFKADLEFGYLAKLVKINGETLEANSEGKYEFDVTAEHVDGLRIDIKTRRSADKSLTKFYAEEGPFSGNKYVDEAHVDTMLQDNDNRFLFQTQIKCADIDNKADVTWSGVTPSTNYARAIVDIAEAGIYTKVYRMYIYNEGGETILHLDVHNNTSFVAVKHKLDENQIDKIKNNGLNVFFAQTGEQIYDVYLENGADEAVSHVTGSTYDCTSFVLGDYVSMWRSTQNGYDDVIIPITGYFYGQGMDADDAANTLLAPISVEKTISEGVTVTGLNDTYKVGDKASFEVSLEFGYELDAVMLNGNVLEANAEGKYEFDVTAEHIGGLVTEIQSKRSADKSFEQFFNKTGYWSGKATIDSTDKETMEKTDGNRFLFHTNFQLYENAEDESVQFNESTGIVSNSSCVRVLFDVNDGSVYRIYVCKDSDECYLYVDVHNDVTNANQITRKAKISLSAEQVAKLMNDGLDVFFVQTGETTYETYVDDGTGIVAKVEGSAYTNATGNHITQYRSYEYLTNDPNVLTVGYFYGKGMDAEEAANTLLAPISVKTTVGEEVTVEGLNNTYQVGDKVSFTTILDYGYGIESIFVNSATISANESEAYEFEVTTEHMNGIIIEVATTNKALSQFVTWTGLYDNSNAAQLLDKEKNEMKDDNGAGVIFHTEFANLNQLSVDKYERVLFDRYPTTENGSVYRIYVYRRAGGYTLTINTYNNGATLVNEYPLQDIGSNPSKLDVFFVQTGENTYATYYVNANGDAVFVEGSENTHGDHITQYRNYSSEIADFATTGYFYGTGFASGEEAVNALVESLKQE